MTEPLISVVVPCFNAATTVAETLESALRQEVDLEVIAIDDGSSDSTAQVLDSFGDRITGIFGPNRGVSAARNSGAERARGRWVQFLDSDDLLCEGTLAQRLAIAGSDYDMVVCDWREFSVDAGSVSEGRLRSVDLQALQRDPEIAFATDVWAPPAAVLYRRDLVERIGGFRRDLPVIQDARYLYDAAYHGARIVHSAHIGARYRIVPGSLSRRDPSRFWRDVLVNGQGIEAMWKARGPLDEPRRKALRDIYNQAARGLFSCGDDGYFEAGRELTRLGGPPLHFRLSSILARGLGLRTARRIMGLVGR